MLELNAIIMFFLLIVYAYQYVLPASAALKEVSNFTDSDANESYTNIKIDLSPWTPIKSDDNLNSLSLVKKQSDIFSETIVFPTSLADDNNSIFADPSAYYEVDRQVFPLSPSHESVPFTPSQQEYLIPSQSYSIPHYDTNSDIHFLTPPVHDSIWNKQQDSKPLQGVEEFSDQVPKAVSDYLRTEIIQGQQKKIKYKIVMHTPESWDKLHQQLGIANSYGVPQVPPTYGKASAVEVKRFSPLSSIIKLLRNSIERANKLNPEQREERAKLIGNLILKLSEALKIFASNSLATAADAVEGASDVGKEVLGLYAKIKQQKLATPYAPYGGSYSIRTTQKPIVIIEKNVGGVGYY